MDAGEPPVVLVLEVRAVTPAHDLHEEHSSYSHCFPVVEKESTTWDWAAHDLNEEHVVVVHHERFGHVKLRRQPRVLRTHGAERGCEGWLF